MGQEVYTTTRESGQLVDLPSQLSSIVCDHDFPKEYGLASIVTGHSLSSVPV